MATRQPDYETHHPINREAWRQWLQKNHQLVSGIWLVYYKVSTGKRSFTYAEAVEEALCFGWIDSLPRKLDAKRAMLKFTPRKPGSAWSALNKERVARLMDEKKMTKAGLEKIIGAKKDGSWDALNISNYHTSENSIPGDLREAFGKNKKALENFNGFAAGYRKQFLFWIDSAKREETRKQRIQQTVLMSAANKKPGIKGFKL